MKQYLLSVYQPDGGRPPADVMERIDRDLAVLNRDLKAAGAWVFANALHPATSATVLRSKDGEILVTDGPFAEGKEHLGGISIINAPDLDAALEWGGRLARATGLPIEVRPFQGESQDV